MTKNKIVDIVLEIDTIDDYIKVDEFVYKIEKIRAVKFRYTFILHNMYNQSSTTEKKLGDRCTWTSELDFNMRELRKMDSSVVVQMKVSKLSYEEMCSTVEKAFCEKSLNKGYNYTTKYDKKEFDIKGYNPFLYFMSIYLYMYIHCVFFPCKYFLRRNEDELMTHKYLKQHITSSIYIKRDIETENIYWFFGLFYKIGRKFVGFNSNTLENTSKVIVCQYNILSFRYLMFFLFFFWYGEVMTYSIVMGFYSFYKVSIFIIFNLVVNCALFLTTFRYLPKGYTKSFMFCMMTIWLIISLFSPFVMPILVGLFFFFCYYSSHFGMNHQYKERMLERLCLF